MPTVHEQISEQFSAWEVRGRGWQVFPEPTTPEPPFIPFRGYKLQKAVDDGIRPTLLSSLMARASRYLSTDVKPVDPPPLPPEQEEIPTLYRPRSFVEFQTTLPSNLNIQRESLEAFLASIRSSEEPLSFELLGTNQKIFAQFAVDPSDSKLVRRQLGAFFPEATFVATEGSLLSFEDEASEYAVVDFGLEREFFHPLAHGKIDPFVAIIGAMEELAENETALFQVIFQQCSNPWADTLLRYVSDPIGKNLFVNQPDFASSTKDKVSKPLFGVVLRVAVRAETFDRAWEVLREIAGTLTMFSHPHGNEFIPLNNEEYPYADHLEDVLRRQSRRSGMLLNADELIGLVHLPSPQVRAAKFLRQSKSTKAAPSSVAAKSGLVLGTNHHAGTATEVRLTPDQRTKHVHIVGASGMGKSTLLFNSILQDIQNGEGLAVLDPHGDLIDQVLSNIPESRIKDVILIDPADETASIGFNILSAHSDLEKTLLASDLISVFQRLSQSWGDQMESVLRNAILAFLESTKGGNLSDLQRFLLDSKYRESFLKTVTDPNIRFYWEIGFKQLSGNKSIGPVITRLENFLSPKPLRYMVAQQKNNLDFAHILDSGKILLARLAQGSIGKANAYLLGSLLMAKFQQTAMARQRQEAKARRDFWIYLDEFQHFVMPSLAEMLTGARKYRVGLVLAHQELRQLERDTEVASSVLSNCYTRIVFRVSDSDAQTLQKGFSTFEANDLQNLQIGQAIARVERSDNDFNLTILLPQVDTSFDGEERKIAVIEASRSTYATPRHIIEAEESAAYGNAGPDQSEQPITKTAKPMARSEESAKDDASRERRTTPIKAAPAESATLPATIFEPAKEKVEPDRNLKHPAVSAPDSFPTEDADSLVPEHQALKERLAEEARNCGYLADLEKRVKPSKRRIDLFLERGQELIACELSFTTTPEWELQNIEKCFEHGATHVAMISPAKEKLKKIKKLASATLAEKDLALLAFYQPDEFVEQLKTWNAKLKASGPVKQKFGDKLSPEEKASQEAIYMKQLQENFKKKKKL